MDLIKKGFLSMNKGMVVAAINERIHQGEDAFQLLRECQAAMEEIGRKFETGEFFVSELMYSAEVFKAVSPILEEALSKTREGKPKSLGPILFGTPEGDIHDLGKNLVITFMRANGFKVIDLGVNVPIDVFVRKLQETQAPIVAMSALITPGITSMKRVVEALAVDKIREKTFVLIGGAMVTDLVLREVKADARGEDPTVAVRICREYLAKKTL